MSGRFVGLAALVAVPLAALGITATAGAAPRAVPARPTRPAVEIHPPKPGTLWITNYGDDSLLSFAPASTGDAAPIARIAGSNTQLSDPSGVAIDTRGRIWVANHATSTVTVYSPLADGNAQPLFSIAGAKTRLFDPLGIAITRAGSLWVASSNNLLEFGPNARGNVAPRRVIGGPHTGIMAAAGVAVTLSGKHVWVANRLSDDQHASLEEFSTAAHGDAVPTKRITGPRTTLDDPYGIAVGISGDTPVTDNEDQTQEQFSLLRFATTATGNARPTHIITGSNTGLATPTLIAINASGAVWVPNYVSNVVSRFNKWQRGNVAPELDLTGPDTGLNHPLGIADFITAPSAPRSLTATRPKTTLHLRWKSPAVHGGGIVGYRISRAPRRSGPWTLIATTTTIRTSWSKPHGSVAHYYRVQAYNNAGFSPQSKPRKPSR